MFIKRKTNKEVKVCQKEIDIIKKEIINKEKGKIIKKKTVFRKEVNSEKSYNNDKKIKKDLIVKEILLKIVQEILIFVRFGKCSIDEISKYLIKQGKKIFLI